MTNSTLSQPFATSDQAARKPPMPHQPPHRPGGWPPGRPLCVQRPASSEVIRHAPRPTPNAKRQTPNAKRPTSPWRLAAIAPGNNHGVPSTTAIGQRAGLPKNRVQRPARSSVMRHAKRSTPNAQPPHGASAAIGRKNNRHGPIGQGAGLRKTVVRPASSKVMRHAPRATRHAQRSTQYAQPHQCASEVICHPSCATPNAQRQTLNLPMPPAHPPPACAPAIIGRSETTTGKAHPWTSNSPATT